MNDIDLTAAVEAGNTELEGYCALPVSKGAYYASKDQMHKGDAVQRVLEAALPHIERQVKAEAWQEGHGNPCDEWVVDGMCPKYHPNPYRGDPK